MSEKNWKKEGAIKGPRAKGRIYFVKGLAVFSAPMKHGAKARKAKRGRK